jgi:DNA polymerase sigma
MKYEVVAGRTKGVRGNNKKEKIRPIKSKKKLLRFSKKKKVKKAQVLSGKLEKHNLKSCNFFFVVLEILVVPQNIYLKKRKILLSRIQLFVFSIFSNLAFSLFASNPKPIATVVCVS